MSLIQYEVHKPTSPVQLNLAKQYFDTLPETDINRTYYNGATFRPVKGFFASYLQNRFSQYQKLDTLSKFYPYQHIVQETVKAVDSDFKSGIENALLFTGASWFFLYQFAKRGRVLPILKEYGSLFQTHRLFRQYGYTLVFPLLYTTESLFRKYHDHIELLQGVHVNRLNAKDLSDPAGTEYPESLRNPYRSIYVNKWH